MDLHSYLTPWNIGGGLFGLVLGATVIVSLLVNRRQMSAALAKVSQRLFSPVGFFGLVIVIFMVISVLESGEFFNVNITHGAIFGLLGYALALGFDLVSVVCMQARLNATRMRDERGSRLNLVGVSICAAVSAFANAAGSLQGYHPVDLNHTPLWMQVCAPWFGMVFPALIVVLSMTADHILDHTPSSGIDVDTFRARERKRVEMLRVRLETERELLLLETELSALRRTHEQTSGHAPREWIFWRWLRPEVPLSSGTASDELTTIVNQTVQAAHAALERHLGELHTILRTLHPWMSTVDEQLRTLHLQMERILGEQFQRARAGAHEERGISLYAHEERNRGAQSVRMHGQMKPEEVADPSLESTGEEKGNAAERILVAFQSLGADTTDTSVARHTGYSRTTVARWKKRFQEQGLLSAPATSVLPEVAQGLSTGGEAGVAEPAVPPPYIPDGDDRN